MTGASPGRELLERFELSWPEGSNPREVVEAVLEKHLSRWAETLPWAPVRPETQWLSDQVLQLRVASVTMWVVLTQRELSLFWEAPAMVRLMLPPRRLKKLLARFRSETAAALATPADAPSGSP